MKKGCWIATVSIILILGVISGLVYIMVVGTKTNVPPITVIVTDDVNNHPVQDVLVLANYSFVELDGGVYKTKAIVALTDSSGAVTLDLPTIVDNIFQDNFNGLTLRVVHPRTSEDNRGLGTYEFLELSELQTLTSPIRFRRTDIERLPAMPEELPEELRSGVSSLELLGGAVQQLPEYNVNMSRINRAVDTMSYIVFFRSNLERICDTPYTNIVAQNTKIGLARTVVSPGQVKYWIEEVSRKLEIPAQPGTEPMKSETTAASFARWRAQTTTAPAAR